MHSILCDKIQMIEYNDSSGYMVQSQASRVRGCGDSNRVGVESEGIQLMGQPCMQLNALFFVLRLADTLIQGARNPITQEATNGTD